MEALRGVEDQEPHGSGSRRRSTPLHSPKLTQGRAHPAVVNSTPAGERQRPRVRRGHVEKTRGGGLPPQQSVSNHETSSQILNRSPDRGSARWSVTFFIVTAVTQPFASQIVKRVRRTFVGCG